MTNLLIDIGNTRLKWARGGGNGIKMELPIVHGNDQFVRQLRLLWREIDPAPRCLVVACVASEAVLNAVKRIASEFWPQAEWRRARSQAVGGGVINGYRYPEKLGVDRWLCLLAARRLGSESVCIVDCGTAITIDAMTEQGRHLGGLIAPGLFMMKQSLFAATAQLPITDRPFRAGLADTTEAAIHGGTLWAAVGLIEAALNRQAGTFKLILTGGDAEAVASHLDRDFIIVPDLVLQGLASVLED